MRNGEMAKSCDPVLSPKTRSEPSVEYAGVYGHRARVCSREFSGRTESRSAVERVAENRASIVVVHDRLMPFYISYGR